MQDKLEFLNFGFDTVMNTKRSEKTLLQIPLMNLTIDTFSEYHIFISIEVEIADHSTLRIASLPDRGRPPGEHS